MDTAPDAALAAARVLQGSAALLLDPAAVAKRLQAEEVQHHALAPPPLPSPSSATPPRLRLCMCALGCALYTVTSCLACYVSGSADPPLPATYTPTSTGMCCFLNRSTLGRCGHVRGQSRNPSPLMNGWHVHRRGN